MVVDDEKKIIDFLKLGLEREGFEVISARDGAAGLALAEKEKPNLILLDIMLPKIDGLEVLASIRKKSNVPVIMLTAKGEEVDKVVGLEMGADDYIAKPFGFRELLARVRTVLRRFSKAKEKREVEKVGELTFDWARHEVHRGKQKINLRPKEYDLLKYLVQNAGLVLSRTQILEAVWGYDFYGDLKAVNVHIRHLREKLEKNPNKPKYVLTVRGAGYKFEA